MKTIAFLGTHDGGDSAVLTYNLAWMYAQLGLKVLCVDLTASAQLTRQFFTPNQLEDRWLDSERGYGFFGALWPLIAGQGVGRLHVETEHSWLPRDVAVLLSEEDPTFEELRRRIGVVPGDPAAVRFHSRFERAWEAADHANALEIVLACRKLVRQSAQEHGVGMVVVDLGPSLAAHARGPPGFRWLRCCNCADSDVVARSRHVPTAAGRMARDVAALRRGRVGPGDGHG